MPFASNLMVGYYRTYHGSYRGEIRLRHREIDHEFYVFNPPEQLWQHPHGECFVPRGNGKYWVHFNVKPKNVDAGIITIEKILSESLERY